MAAVVEMAQAAETKPVEGKRSNIPNVNNDIIVFMQLLSVRKAMEYSALLAISLMIAHSPTHHVM